MTLEILRKYLLPAFDAEGVGSGGADEIVDPDDNDEGDDNNEGKTEEEIKAAADAKAEAKAKKPKKDAWVQPRINRLTAEKKEALRVAAQAVADKEAAELELTAARALLEKAQKKDKDGEVILAPDKGKKTIDLKDPEVQAELARIAEARISTKTLDQQCDAVYDLGKAEYKADWDVALDQFKSFEGLRVDLAKVIVKLPNGADILYHLGKNPDEIARIYEITDPVDLALEATKMSNELAKTKAKDKETSKAPNPPKPINGKGNNAVDLANADVPMDQWVAAREADMKKRGVRI